MAFLSPPPLSITYPRIAAEKTASATKIGVEKKGMEKGKKRDEKNWEKKGKGFSPVNGKKEIRQKETRVVLTAHCSYNDVWQCCFG